MECRWATTEGSGRNSVVGLESRPNVVQQMLQRGKYSSRKSTVLSKGSGVRLDRVTSAMIVCGH